MTKSKAAFRGLLRQRVDLAKAPAAGLGAQAGKSPDKNDFLKYIQNEFRARWTEFDKQFGLDEMQPDLWEQRAYILADKCIPGFQIKKPGRASPGAPSIWTDRMLMQLYADIEYEKQKIGRSVRKICEDLRTDIYRRKWGSFEAAALRNGYRLARERQSNILFFLDLVGGEGPLPTTTATRNERAIKRHALKLNPRRN